MITGVSLSGIDATLVVLQCEGDGYRPITLGITGTYDRTGSIEGVRENLNTQLVLRYFVERHRDSRLFAENQINKGEQLTSDSDIEELLQLIERTNAAIGSDHHSASTVLDGAVIVFALIAQPVWDAIVDGAPTPERSADRQFQQLFGETSLAGEIYRGQLPNLATPLDQLSAVNDFVDAHGLRWVPPSEPSQRYPIDYGGQHSYEIREFLDRAKRDYADDPAIQVGLAAYEQLIDWDDEGEDTVTAQVASETHAEILARFANAPAAERAVRLYANETVTNPEDEG
ncbi:hypothetical protein [Nocardia acidivorans]|uniref:hypothetical protein n=1 Tax=Nocardia acidivorans TaxID=404580 RepID=UPI001C3F7219|nr:hypothetical protein [Nocardia acidivorans]